MKKVLIVYNFLHHYRIPVFNLLSERYDLTVVHSGKYNKDPSIKFNQVVLDLTKFGPFYFQHGLNDIAPNTFDSIIILCDIRWVSNLLFFLKGRNRTKLISWGFWLTKSGVFNRIRLALASRFDANVFYTVEALKDFENIGLTDGANYVANNTFDVNPRVSSYNNAIKDTILFVGTLNKRKRLDEVLDSFSRIISDIDEDINFVIIGDGEELSSLRKRSSDLGISSRVRFLGGITDSNELIPYYKRALCSVSYGQAGLSVLQALGFGVPFVTRRDAISGGEKTNILDGENGFLLDPELSDLDHKLRTLCKDKSLAKSMGRRAFDYYTTYCTIENMANGFVDAIEDTSTTNILTRVSK